MQVQIIKGATRHRALAEARRVLGEDPLVLSVRRKPSSRADEQWEVVVARETPEPILPPSDYEPQVEEGFGLNSLESLTKELSTFRHALRQGGNLSADILTLAHRLTQLETDLLATSLSGSSLPTKWLPLLRRLESVGYSREQAMRLVKKVDDVNIPDQATPNWQEFSLHLKSAITDGVEVAPVDERLNPKVVIFAGGAGVGKSTLVAKLAADLCLGGTKRPIIGAIKPRKGAGVEMLRRCAKALKIPFAEIESPEEVIRLRKEDSARPIILDTASVNPLDEQSIMALRNAAGEIADAEVHAVIPASFGDHEFQRHLDSFCFAGANRMSVTHLDESPMLGRVMVAAAKSKLPIGYMSLGPRIPDDLVRPGLDTIVESILRPEGSASL